MEDVQAFYRQYHHCSNSILSLTGNFDAVQVDELVQKYFGQLNGVVPEIPRFSFSANGYSATRMVIEAAVPLASFYLAFPMPGRGHPAYYALDLVTDLLAVGRSSLLYQTFIKQNQLLSNVDAYITGNIETGLLMVEGKLSQGANITMIEKAFWDLIDQLLEVGVPPTLMQKLKNTSESNFQFSEIGTLNKAMNLGYFELVGDIELINKEAQIYQEITPEFLMQTIKTYITPQNASILHYIPGKT